MKKGKGVLSVLAVLMLFVSVSVGAVSATQIDVETSMEETSNDMGILRDTKRVGSMETDAENNIATASGVGPITVPIGYNTFTASYKGIKDEPLDGQGSIFRLTVWDAAGGKDTKEIKIDAAAAGTLEVSLSSQVKGEGQYELWCGTHGWFDRLEASDTYTGVIHFV